jgi:hypothetical protein
VPNYDSTGNLRVNLEGQKHQYTKVVYFNVGFSGPAQIVGLWGVSGGGRICRIQQIGVDFVHPSGSYFQEAQIEFYTSGFGQSGFPQIVSGGPHDPSSPPSSGNLIWWSGLPLSGSWGKQADWFRRPTSVTQNLLITSGLATADNVANIFDFTKAGFRHPTLRNPFQGVVVNISGTSTTPNHSGLLGVRVRYTWTEETPNT